MEGVRYKENRILRDKNDGAIPMLLTKYSTQSKAVNDLSNALEDSYIEILDFKDVFEERSKVFMDFLNDAKQQTEHEKIGEKLALVVAEHNDFIDRLDVLNHYILKSYVDNRNKFEKSKKEVDKTYKQILPYKGLIEEIFTNSDERTSVSGVFELIKENIDKSYKDIDEKFTKIQDCLDYIQNSYNNCNAVFEDYVDELNTKAIVGILSDLENLSKKCTARHQDYETMFDRYFKEYGKDYQKIKEVSKKDMLEYKQDFEVLRAEHKRFETITNNMTKVFNGSIKDIKKGNAENKAERLAKKQENLKVVKEKIQQATKIMDTARINYKYDESKYNERIHAFEVAGFNRAN